MIVGADQIRVLVVSASPYTRYVISGGLNAAPDLFVVGTAKTADEVIDKLPLLRPDLMVVDLQSPETLSFVQMGLPVLGVCGRTAADAELALAALQAGMTDIVACADSELGLDSAKGELVRRVRYMKHVTPQPWGWPSVQSATTKTVPRPFGPGDRVVVVSASTGGLEPLVQMFVDLPVGLDAAFVVLLSLPAAFMPALIRRLDPVTTVNVRTARAGLPLQRGVAYLVPCDYQVTAGSRGVLVLDREALLKVERFSVDATMSTLATRYGPAVIAVLLSGAGQDGVKGALSVRAAGGQVLVQAIETCVAREMPEAVVRSGVATAVPPQQIAAAIAARAGCSAVPQTATPARSR